MDNESNPLIDIINALSNANQSNNDNNLNAQYVEQTNKNTNQDINILDIINNLGLANKADQNIKPKEENSFDLNSKKKKKKIISAFSKEDPRKNLLAQLKPFLRESRKSKIDQYITYFSVITALGIFDSKEWDIWIMIISQ